MNMRQMIRIIESQSGDPRRLYRMGLCDAMALALHATTKLPLGLWRGFFPDPDGDEGDEGYEDCHAVVVLSFDPPKWIDVDGMHDGEPENCQFGEQITRLQLVPASKREVAEAFTTFDDDLKTHVIGAKKFIKSDSLLSSTISRFDRNTTNT